MRVPWKELSGEATETIVAGLLAVRRVHATQVTPGRGDEGMDIVDLHDDGSLDVYQVKRYSGPLTAQQRKRVEASLAEVHAAVERGRRISAWHLVMPWNPTPKDLTWFEALREKFPGIPLRWIGRTRLDTWAAEAQHVVRFHLGDESRDDLLKVAMTARLPDDSIGVDDLLAAIQAHDEYLSRMLDKVDPYYRYEVWSTRGDPDSVAQRARSRWEAEPDFGGLMVEEGEHGLVRAVAAFPKTALSHVVSPIRANLELNARVGSPEHAQIEDFLTFGTPLESAAARVTRSDGPARIAPPLGDVTVSVQSVGAVDALPGLELAALNDDGQDLVVVPLPDLTRTVGMRGGARLTARDATGTITLTISYRPGEGAPMSIEPQIAVESVPGQRATAMHRVYRMLSHTLTGGRIEIRQEDGGLPLGVIQSVPGEWTQQQCEDLRISAEYTGHLTTIQRHVGTPIVAPEMAHETREAVASVYFAGLLLRGEALSVSGAIVLPAAAFDRIEQGRSFEVAVEFTCDVEDRTIALPGVVVYAGASATILEVDDQGTPAPDGYVLVAPGGDGTFTVRWRQPDTPVPH